MTLSLFPDRAPTIADLFGDDPDQGTLRYYQEDGKALLLKAFESEASALMVMATGLGKTVLFCEIARGWQDGNVLVLCDRDELVSQSRAALEKATGAIVEVEQGDWRASPNAKYVVGSIDSFHKDRLLKMAPNRFGLVIIDEAHRMMSDARLRVARFFQGGGAKLLGATATPDVAEEKALGQLYDCVPVCMGIEDGIDSGYLVPIEAISITVEEVELDKVSVGKANGGKDFDQGELDQEMLKGVQGVVNKVAELYPERKGIAFFPGIRSAELAAECFNSIRPGSAAFVCATTDKFVRRRIIADFRAGKIQYFCNVDVASAGLDVPVADMVILASPTMSRALYTQRVGRGTRVLPGVVDFIPGEHRAAERRAAIAASAKPNLLLLDFVGAGSRHSLSSIEDVLGGNYEPAEVAKAKEIREKSGSTNPRDALEKARAELVRLAQVKAAKVTASVRDFDPFRVYELDDTGRYAKRFGEKLATPKQVELLLKFKMEQSELVGITKRAAEKLLKVCFERSKLKLCTFKQLRMLKQFGITRTDITFARARMALDYIAEMGWGRGQPIDPGKLNELVYGTRESGED